jgi:hypothetical protein
MTLSRGAPTAAAPAGLPPSVATYIAATNAFDADALIACFAEGGDKVTMKVVKVVEHFGDVIVTANVDGDYDKTGLPGPLVLAFHFVVRAGKIARLIILNNRTADSSPEIRSLRAALASHRPPDTAPEE